MFKKPINIIKNHQQDRTSIFVFELTLECRTIHWFQLLMKKTYNKNRTFILKKHNFQKFNFNIWLTRKKLWEDIYKYMEKLEVSYTVSERSLIRQTNRWWYTQPRFHRTFQLIQQNFEIKNQQQKKQGGQLLWYHGNPIFLISRNDIILSNISLKNQSRSRGPKWLIYAPNEDFSKINQHYVFDGSLGTYHTA